MSRLPMSWPTPNSRPHWESPLFMPCYVPRVNSGYHPTPYKYHGMSNGLVDLSQLRYQTLSHSLPLDKTITIWCRLWGIGKTTPTKKHFPLLHSYHHWQGQYAQHENHHNPIPQPIPTNQWVNVM